MHGSYQGWEASVACKNVAIGDVIESWPLISKTGRVQRKITPSRSFSTLVYMLHKTATSSYSIKKEESSIKIW